MVTKRLKQLLDFNSKSSRLGQLIDKSSINANSKTAQRISYVSGNNLDELKLKIASELSDYMHSDNLHRLFRIPNRYFNEILDYVKEFNLFILASKKSEHILISWLGSKSWEVNHKSNLNKYLELGIKDLLIDLNDNLDLLDITSWINPKLTADKVKNRASINKLLNSIK